LTISAVLNRRVAVFSVNHIQSAPTITQVKNIHAMYDRLQAQGIEEVYCISFCDFVMFDFLMPKFSKKIKFLQLGEADLQEFQQLLNKRGNPKFLKDYWQFACVLNNGTVEHYLDQPFRTKVGADTLAEIYSEVTPALLSKRLDNV
jgi:peroxiredoxin